MFSSFLPNASSSMKLQNGPPKSSNRFSVRVFKTQTNLPFTYPSNAKPDVGYRPPPLREQNSNWYPASNNHLYDTRPRTTTNYAIYPSATDGTFIYEQSTCSKSDIFSTSELDADSMATFSPALSTDSTITLASTNGDDLGPSRPAAPATRPGHSHGQVVSQAPVMGQVTSTSRQGLEAPLQARSATPIRPTSSTRNENMAQMPSAVVYNGHIPEYAASTISELEVEERDRIAKINAGYNSTPSASLYSSNSTSSADADRHRMPASSQNLSSLGHESFGPAVLQQPLHPGLQFPTRPLDLEFTQPMFPNNPSSYSQTLPLVERMSSQRQGDHQPPSGPQPSSRHPLTTGETWSRETVQDSQPIRTQSQRSSPKNIPEAFEANLVPSSRSVQSTYGTSIQNMPSIIEQRQDRPFTPAPVEPRTRRSSFVGPRPDLSGILPPSESRDYGISRGSADYRQVEDSGRRGPDPVSSSAKDYADRRDTSSSPPRGQQVQTSSRDNASRNVLGADLRRDSRTPLPREADEYRSNYASRRDSYVPEASRAPKDTRRQSPTDNRDIFKSSIPLSSSPTQIRASPTEIEPIASRRGPFVAPPDQEPTKERSRTRSISFSTSVRPTLPPQNSGYHISSTQQTQSYSTAASEARHSSDQERYTRGSDRSPTAVYESQLQRQVVSGVPPPSRTMERAPSNMPNQAYLQSRGATTLEASASRSRAEVAHSHPQPQPPPHTEPIRRLSDGDKPYGSNITPRGTVLYDMNFKVVGPPGSWHANMPVGGTTISEPHARRNSDGDQNPLFRPPMSGRISAPLLRSVRWNDNLICPSPIPCSARRKGWFNRRGDQLWTNDGAYRAAPAGQEYPPDLDDYPEYEEGWMNEECTRIDMNHRLIPKPPLRSALKPAKN